MRPIRLIAGLGNPGPEHTRTRHNAGFWFLERLAEALSVRLLPESKLSSEVGRATVDGRALLLLKPTTYMNRSGQALSAALRYYKLDPEEALVAHDDLDLPPGVARFKLGGGHGGQNGLRDILQQLGKPGFWRLRLGIGHPGHKDRVTPWVLSRPGVEHERAIVGACEAALSALPELLAGKPELAMQRLHTPRALAPTGAPAP